MLHRLVRLGVVAVGAAVLTALPLTASAHDVHTFGKFTVALGWLHEPAYVGFDNAVQVLIKDKSGNAFTDISDKDLTVEVSLGSAKMPAKPLTPTADPDTGLGIPGEYEMHFIPTAPGAYTFHIHGTVGGQAIDESVQAGDKTFDEVKDASEVQFPTTVPATSELSTRIQTLGAEVDANRSSEDDRSRRAEYLGIAGIALAVVIGGLALVMSLRSRS